MGTDKNVHVKHSFIRDQLVGCLRDVPVVLFLEGIFVVGTVRRIEDDFVELTSVAGTLVEVRSESTGAILRTFNRLFVKISEIQAFGQEILPTP